MIKLSILESPAYDVETTPRPYIFAKPIQKSSSRTSVTSRIYSMWQDTDFLIVLVVDTACKSIINNSLISRSLHEVFLHPRMTHRFLKAHTVSRVTGQQSANEILDPIREVFWELQIHAQDLAVGLFSTLGRLKRRMASTELIA